MSLSPDELLHERYRIVRILKSGGMGSVYEAIDTKLADSPCAVKEIHEAALASRDANYIQTRFYEEMKALVALDHGSIPKVRDYLTEDAKVYIVMELVQGRSLQDEIDQRFEMKEDPPVDYIVLDMIRLLDTLTYLHQQEPPVIHRDVKPANILRDGRSGMIKLVDFGLARSADGPNTQTVVGTMGYCAPEQLMGKAEPRSDVYAVGVTLMHLLTGVAPEMELFEARKPDLPGLRPGLELIIEKATQIKPADRYTDAAEMSLALQTWLHRPSQVQPLAVAARAAEQPPALGPLSTPRGKAMAGALVLLAMLGGFGFSRMPKAKAPSQALVPTASPTVSEATLQAAANHLVLPAASLKQVTYKAPPPKPKPKPRYEAPSYSNQTAGYQPARSTFRQRRAAYRAEPTYRPRRTYRQPTYNPPPVQVNVGGGGIQAQINGPGGIRFQGGFR
jgi:serine/threonine protein kinase